MKDSVDVVIVAAGKGNRLGDPTPKAFVPLAGEPLFTHALRVFAAHPLCGHIVVVVPSDRIEHARTLVDALSPSATVELHPGGQQRWESVKSGVVCCRGSWVMVHDAARPFVTHRVIDTLLAKRETYRCAITATPVVDTIRSFTGDRCVDTLDRSQLLRVGTPQLFQRDTLVAAFDRIKDLPAEPTDEAMLMEACGIAVGVAWGDPLNFKITTPEDMYMAEAILARRTS